MEALACGLPALVSDIPGNREWMHPGRAGFSRMATTRLSRDILQAYVQRGQLATFEAAARQLAEQRADWPKQLPKAVGRLSAGAGSPPRRHEVGHETIDLKSRVIAIIQGRMSSSRLPGKILIGYRRKADAAACGRTGQHGSNGA